MITGRRPTKSAPLVIVSMSVALPSALAGLSHTAPPSVPSDRTKMSWSCGTRRPAAWNFCVNCCALSCASLVCLLPL